MVNFSSLMVTLLEEISETIPYRFMRKLIRPAKIKAATSILDDGFPDRIQNYLKFLHRRCGRVREQPVEWIKLPNDVTTATAKENDGSWKKLWFPRPFPYSFKNVMVDTNLRSPNLYKVNDCYTYLELFSIQRLSHNRNYYVEHTFLDLKIEPESTCINNLIKNISVTKDIMVYTELPNRNSLFWSKSNKKIILAPLKFENKFLVTELYINLL
ncbi:hypothetical protein FQA39_LY16762 [Lamprigera yunnana]|nr:hypothetical protein FQA39_LY16762 [Lamprigera yunnana]